MRVNYVNEKGFLRVIFCSFVVKKNSRRRIFDRQNHNKYLKKAITAIGGNSFIRPNHLLLFQFLLFPKEVDGRELFSFCIVLHHSGIIILIMTVILSKQETKFYHIICVGHCKLLKSPFYHILNLTQICKTAGSNRLHNSVVY